MVTHASLGNLLIIDDDHTIGELLRLNLSSEGYNITLVPHVSEVEPDDLYGIHLILIDAAHQSPSGLEFIEKLKQTPSGDAIGVIYYSDFPNDRTLVEALDAGADDAICKPFSLREMLARIRAVMRRRRRFDAPQNTTNTIIIDDLRIDLVKKSVMLEDEFVNLSNTEFAILELLLRNADTYTSRIEIFRNVWSDGTGANERIVDTNISRMRRKLGDAGALITNRTGLGYMIKLKG